MEKNPYIELAECLLPEEMIEYFEVVKVEKTKETLDVTLEERDKGVEGYAPEQLRPNGFYEESTVRDYPVKGTKDDIPCKATPLGGSRDRQKRVKALGYCSRRHPLLERVCGFLKGMLGQIPDYGPLS